MTKEKVDGAASQEKNADDVAAIIALLGGPEAVEVIGGIVVAKLGEILPPIVEAQLRDLLTGDDAIKIAGPNLEELLTAIKPQLPDLIVELVPSVKAEREQAAAREQAEQDASNARKLQAKRDRATAKAEEDAAADRAKKIGAAQGAFAKAFGPDADTEGFAVADVETVGLALDDGKTFCVDFLKEIDGAKLVQQDGMIRLAEKIVLPADIPAFTVRGISISDGADAAMRCEIATPLHIGLGRRAELAADSLIFRAPVKPAAETA